MKRKVLQNNSDPARSNSLWLRQYCRPDSCYTQCLTGSQGAAQLPLLGVWKENPVGTDVVSLGN
jgi:hypothetical protein